MLVLKKNGLDGLLIEISKINTIDRNQTDTRTKNSQLHQVENSGVNRSNLLNRRTGRPKSQDVKPDRICSVPCLVLATGDGGDAMGGREIGNDVAPCNGICRSNSPSFSAQKFRKENYFR